MIVRRDRSRGRWTAMPNDAFELSPSDGGLSLSAKGLLAWLLVKPDSWEINVNAIRAKTGIGRDVAYGLLKELIAAGYVERIQKRDDRSRVAEYTYVVYDEPDPNRGGAFAVPLPEIQEAVRSPRPGLPDTETPDPVNQDAYRRSTGDKTAERRDKTSLALPSLRDDQRMFDALCLAFRVAPGSVTAQTRGQFNRWIKGWRNDGVEPSHLERAAVLYLATFRGRRNEAPSKNDMSTQIARARSEGDAGDHAAEKYLAN